MHVMLADSWLGEAEQLLFSIPGHTQTAGEREIRTHLLTINRFHRSRAARKQDSFPGLSAGSSETTDFR